MRCKFCGFTNGDDDHRCLRCGRRVGTAISAPAGFSGANALAVAPSFDANETQDFLPVKNATPTQTPLFQTPPSNVIPFDQLQKQVTSRLQGTPAPRPAQTPAPPVQNAPAAPGAPVAQSAPAAQGKDKDQPKSPSQQASLDFQGPAAPQRLLKYDIPSTIYCNRPVATPMHRFIAGTMDAAMVLLAFGLFVGLSELIGGSFGTGKLFWGMMAASFTLIAGFYGLIFALTGSETAGMHWTDLQLITFDGRPLDGRSRAARLASTWLSFCSAGLGLVWALADEETLTMHDHISKTFPTVRGSAIPPNREVRR